MNCISPEAARRGLAKARAAKRTRRAHWATLRLRQQWADAPWMRAHLRAAGVSVADDAEPATVGRLRSKLRQAGITAADSQQAVGLPLSAYLRRNPDLPLWAAVALVCEADGRWLTAVQAARQNALKPAKLPT